MELLSAQGVAIRSIVMVKLPQFVLPQLLSLFVYLEKHMLQDHRVDLLIYYLAQGQELTADNAPHIEKHYQQYFVS